MDVARASTRLAVAAEDPAVAAEDGYGDGWTAAEDCDDTNPAIHPGAVEVCDPDDVDEDCNGLADNNDPAPDDATMTTFYMDGDGDGYAGTPERACDLPAGDAEDREDCDDERPGINPGAAEVCDEDNTDEDCDGLADDADPDAALLTFYKDVDADGYGGGFVTSVECHKPNGYYAAETDCNDTDAAIHPGAVDVCDFWNMDENCDGTWNGADAEGATLWHPDEDGDHYGDAATGQEACEPPDGWVEDGSDCDDADGGIHPETYGGEECDGVDEDCDGVVDDHCTKDEGCGCTSAGASGGWALVLVGGALIRRRRATG